MNAPATTFYWDGVDDITLTTSWGTNADGSGTHPANFTTASQIFEFQNGQSATLGGSWTVSGTGSKVVIDNGATFNAAAINPTFTVDLAAEATYKASGGYGNLTFGTISSTSTFDYSGSSASFRTSLTYGGLIWRSSTLVGTPGTFTTTGLFEIALNTAQVVAASATSNTWTIGTDVTIDSSTTLSLAQNSASSTGNATVKIGGGLTNNGTISKGGLSTGTALFEFNGTGSSNVAWGTNSGAFDVQIDSGDTITFADALKSTGKVTINGTLIANGASTYTGGTTLAASGILRLGVNSTGSVTNGPIGTGTLALNGGTLSSDSTTARSIANAITFGGDVTFGTNTNFGALSLSGAGTLTGNRTLTFIADVTYSGNIGDSGGSFGITKAGSGTLVLSGIDSYSGGTTVNAGLLELKSTSAFGSSSGALTVNGGILDLNGQNTSVGNFTGTGGTIWNNGPNAGSSTATLTIGTGNAGGGNYQGVITDNNGAAPLAKVALTKTGTGTITLFGANTYTGVTTVNGGTLLINGSTAAGSAVTVNNTCTLGGTGTVSGTVTVNSGGAILGGAGTSTSGSLTVNNTLTLNSNSVIELALGAPGAHSTLALGGSVSFQTTQQFNFIDLGAQATNYTSIITGVTTPVITAGWTIDNTGWSGLFTYNVVTQSIDLTLTTVPEPSTWASGALALLGIAFTQRKRLLRVLNRA